MPVHLDPGIQFDSAVRSYCAGESCRRHARVLFSVPILVRHLCRGGVRTTQGITLDLGEGGLGAIIQGDVQVGETVAIDLRLCEQLVTTVAIVRHTSSVSAGFEFVGLTPEERLEITNIIGHS